MKTLILLLVVTFCSVSNAKQIKVGVLDSGLGSRMESVVPVCKTGHAVISESHVIATKNPPSDPIGHGSHVSHLIHQSFQGDVLYKNKSPKKYDVKESPYCQIIVRIWDSKEDNSVVSSYVGLKYLIDQKVDIINISGGGYGRSEEEIEAIKQALDLGIKVVAAAGNDNKNIDKKPFYPASADSRIVVVGNLSLKKEKASSSNWGEAVDVWETGEVYAYNSVFGVLFLTKMAGTSQASAIVTGKIIKELIKERENESTRTTAGDKGTEKRGDGKR